MFPPLGIACIFLVLHCENREYFLSFGNNQLKISVGSHTRKDRSVRMRSQCAKRVASRGQADLGLGVIWAAAYTRTQ